ncbi:MAG TPA: 3-dehydroquinate synthase, partial [Candidatus Aminicenantes bacterium]|nr:3-dehydroquinate synthase [Candidatus Aminicenantes bacterium]
MTRLVLNVGGGRSDIRIGVGAFRLEDHALKKRTLILTDRKVQALHGSLFRGWNTLVLDRGEKMKTLAVVERISRALLRRGGDRGATIVGVGGGVICDLAGFAAAVYMRGIRFGFVPTTLLAQADASLGGKNGVNLDRYKNVIGTF